MHGDYLIMRCWQVDSIGLQKLKSDCNRSFPNLTLPLIRNMQDIRVPQASWYGTDELTSKDKILGVLIFQAINCGFAEGVQNSVSRQTRQFSECQAAALRLAALRLNRWTCRVNASEPPLHPQDEDYRLDFISLDKALNVLQSELSFAITSNSNLGQDASIFLMGLMHPRIAVLVNYFRWQTMSSENFLLAICLPA